MATTTTGDTTTATVDSNNPPPLHLDSIPTIDLRLLSQSELYALSISSNSSFDLSRCDDVVIPKINRSVFNESAGSRKQTYSRLRLAPPTSTSTSTTTKTTIHRRTPHLRSSHAHTSTNNINDPEQAENHQIIRVLKHLFKSNPNFHDLVPIEPEINTNVEPTVLPNPEMKRKRGRPRKHENAVFIRPPANKRMRNNTVKKVVVYDDDRDRETVNSRGVKVDLVNLGRLEDPYGAEIRRRTEGMSNADELLGFLRGLKGQWGTTRKKKRVVDAGDFGDALPKGWRLSLSIKKKEGRVWLFCRRYISPSGRQFESCKEVSTYLLSILGGENFDKSSNTQSNNFYDFAVKEASGNAADVFVQEDVKVNTPVHDLVAPSTSLPTDSEKQVKSDIVDPTDVQKEELFKCLKCFMIFEGKVDLFDHHVSAHKSERSQLDSTVSEWTVVIGGIFECQFCEKAFSEKSRYNEHIGTHVTNENRTFEAPMEEMAVDPVLDTEISDKELQAPLSAENNVVMETHDAEFGNELLSASPQSDHKISSVAESKTDEIVHDLNMNEDVLVQESGDESGKKCNVSDNNEPATDKAPDDSVTKSDVSLGHETSMPNNESNEKFESSGGTADCVDDKSECIIEQDQDAVSKTRVTNVDISPFSSELMEKNVVDESASVEVLSHSVPEEKGYQENINDMQICNSFDELTSEKDKVVISESSSGGFSGRLGLDENSVAAMKKLSGSDSLISSKKQESPQKLGFSASVTQVTTHGFDENKFSYGQHEFRNSAFNTFNTSTIQKEDNFTSLNEDIVNKVENEVKNTSSNRSSEANLDDFQLFRNNESINNENVIDFNNERTLEFSSLVPTENEQDFGFQDDLYNNVQESSERGLLDHFCVTETTDDDIFGNIKFDEDRGIGMHELSLTFGNPNSLYSDDTINLDQKKDGVSCSVVSSKTDDTFDVQTNLSMVNNSNNQTRAFPLNNGIAAYSDRPWEDFRSDEFRRSEQKKFMMGSGSSNQQQRNEVVPSGMWKTGQGSQLHSSLANPHSQIQTPSGYHSFDIMSNKGEDGVFRHDGRYNNGLDVDGMRSSNRSEPVEFRFLTPNRSEQQHNPHALQGGSRGVFPYNTPMEPAFDPNFWIGKNSMMPNMTNRNLVTTSVCSWCGNQFHVQSMHLDTQSGVGTLCPACSARISGQANML